MKIKKGLALILALAMIITLMPTMAFAQSTTTASKVVNVAPEDEMPAIELNIETKDSWAKNEPQKIKVTLENAEWTGNRPTAASLGSILTVDHNAADVDKDGNGPDDAEKIELDLGFIASGSNTLEFTITPDYELPDGTDVTLTFEEDAITSGSEAGDINIAIESIESDISDDTVRVAIVVTSTTTTTVTGDVKTFPRGDVDSDDINTTIEIRETAINSLEENSIQTVRLTLPKDVKWDRNNPFELGGDLANENNILDGTGVNGYTITPDGRTVEITFVVTGADDVRNVLTITPDIEIGKNAAEGDITVTVVGTEGTITEPTNETTTSVTQFPTGNNDGDGNPLYYVAETRDVPTVTDAEVVIAAYGTESVEISTVEEVPTIVSGYVETPKDKNFTVSVTMEETMVDALADGRYVDFDLPEEVQISGQIKAKVNRDAQGAADEGAVSIEGIESNPVTDTMIDEDGDIVTLNVAGTAYQKADGSAAKGTVRNIFTTDDTSGFEFQVPDNGNADGDVVVTGDWKAKKANKITFEIPVTVEAGFTGDITMTVTGARAGVEDTELVVATAEAPITVETTTTNVKNGVQTQVVADITLTENYAGYFDDRTGNNEIVLDIDTLGLSKSMVFESCDSIEVTDGNLEINEKASGVEKDGDNPYISIVVDRESTTASTIELKGLTLTLNRTLPEGGYDLKVSGGAIVQNSQYNDGEFSGTAVTVEDYVVITTPADDGAGVNATFTAGQASYTVDGQTVEMDVAPFIDSNNRMLVPIRYAANAMGVSDSNIQWNGYTQTGTISGAMGVVQVTVGSTNLITSNGTITMDTVAVNTNDRIYVPVRYIANALGASVEWDPATRTATFS